jgi:hypothetical protein
MLSSMTDTRYETNKTRQIRAATTKIAKSCAVLVVAAAAASCSPTRPALYPNQKLETADPGVTQQEIDQCIQQARAHYGGGKSKDVAASTAGAAAVGAGVGAAVGAVGGHAGRGAARGAAGGAAGGLMRGLFRSREPNGLEKRYVEACLAEKGYRTLGWQ